MPRIPHRGGEGNRVIRSGILGYEGQPEVHEVPSQVSSKAARDG